MISRFNNLMSIEQFADLALLDKWHVAGYCVGEQEAGCNCDNMGTYTELAFQGKTLSRAEISQAIEEAENLIAQELGYYPAPKAVVGEVHQYPQQDIGRSYKQTRPLSRNTMITRDGKDYKSVQLAWGFLQGLGTYVDTSLGETDTLTMGADNQTFTATLTFTPSPALVGDEEFLVYFTNGDLPEGDEYEAWQVRDVRCTLADAGGGAYTLTIRGGGYLLMPPNKRFGRRWRCLSDSTAGNFVDALQVYSRRLDSTQQGSLQWGKDPCTTPNGCNNVAVRGLCLQRDDKPLAPVVRPMAMNYNSEAGEWQSYGVNTAPDWVVCNYLAGVPRVNGKVDALYAKPIMYLAASLLVTDASNCGCMGLEDRLKVFRDVEKTTVKEQDLAMPNLTAKSDRILAQKKHLEGLWGAHYGAVKAWNLVQSIKDSVNY